ncbi:DNA replication/repair protein RecF [Hydrocarboniclastica marina]|uniref:DNA replication and repair protein RecF n=1 Tax=Hydrocarboniclastica marina TaxID=2259620 RepID=A0A4P7XCF9_9ALTE|nr:DNA replication/repair protein RecF [Hydrocarboniclastica marina]MAM00464.1 DNA replication/repair protein RecF [Alteromonadaceae bacterium]QCF24481.1 DNA replication/repair protein RecF [Hydrocarboniclastica marina]|tara:strand:- start:1779 stop:2918 length:1140 start_codon:yes stop_codon:yes gene_type:complete
MSLLELQTHRFRNLGPDRLQFSPGVNLIYGDNGSGKSSLLEAVHYLSTGRSFRTHKHETVVAHGGDEMAVFGRVSKTAGRSRVGTDPNGKSVTHNLGISRNLAERRTTLRLDGENVRSLSILAQHLPISVIEPGSFDIISGGPGKRRQFLDWVVFHVEHRFAGLWQRCQKVISQRNRLLRSGRIDDALLRAWNQEYLTIANQVTSERQRWFEELVPLVQGLLNGLDAPWASDLSLDLFRGWDRQRELGDVLEQHFDQERKVGHTLYGPNRCDVRIRVGSKPAGETLSRGQQKTLVILLKLAQGELLYRERNISCGFLLDDINAELDIFHQRVLAQQLQRLGSQVFVTSISRPDPAVLWQNAMADLRMFHVEHGVLRKET